MSTEDNHPAQSADTARPVYPVTFFDGSRDQRDSPITDFRAIVLPADAEEPKAAPKEEPAPEIASPTPTATPESPVQSASKAAPKASSPTGPAGASRAPKTTGA